MFHQVIQKISSSSDVTELSKYFSSFTKLRDNCENDWNVYFWRMRNAVALTKMNPNFSFIFSSTSYLNWPLPSILNDLLPLSFFVMILIIVIDVFLNCFVWLDTSLNGLCQMSEMTFWSYGESNNIILTQKSFVFIYSTCFWIVGKRSDLSKIIIFL